MHDIRLIRENPEAFDAALARRGVEPQSQYLLGVDRRARLTQTTVEQLLAIRKTLSNEIGQLMAQGNLEAANINREEVEQIKGDLPLKEEASRVSKQALQTALARLPNLPDADVPDGADETQNFEVSHWGAPRQFNFLPKEHADIGPRLGLDFETGALISGSRFTFLRGQMARLQRALGQFMLDHQTGTNAYTECAPPLLVKDDAVFGTGQFPKFADDLFSTDISLDPQEYMDFKWQAYQAKLAENGQKVANAAALLEEGVWDSFPNPPTRRWLIPTAEVSLTNSVREQILDNAALPIRLTALTPCFRSEAGAAGKDTRGYIRQHQFEKVELVSICRPEDSPAEHERMVKAAESILEALELPYRKLLLCAGDMGFTARKTFDLEVWLPGQNAYREISSISNCGDFQARRMNTRYRPEGAKSNEFVHTLNGSGLAVGRTLVAILENYQQEDGTVQVPEVLHPYMGGVTKLVPMY